MTGPAIHHVQIAIPAGGENAARQFYVDDPFGNRMEILQPL